MGILDIFRNPAVQMAQAPSAMQQPQQMQQQQLPPAAAQSQQAVQNAVPPAFQGTPAATAQSPLDEFNKLFDTNTNQAQTNSSLFSYKPDELQKVVGGINFAQSIPPEQMQQAMSGDPQAFSDVLNSVARQTFLQALQMNSKMVESGVNTGISRFEENLPTKFRSMQVSDNLSTDQTFSHPAVAPMINALRDQFAKAYPKASAGELAGMVKKYLKSVASASVDPSPQPQNPYSAPADADFSSFFRN